MFNVNYVLSISILVIENYCSAVSEDVYSDTRMQIQYLHTNCR